MDSILNSIKKLLGIGEDYDHFDADIMIHINSVFMILNHMGVGPSEVYQITSDLETWEDFIPHGQNIEAVKSYIYLKVKLLFDPPSGSAVMESTNRLISELEWRLNAAADN